MECCTVATTRMLDVGTSVRRLLLAFLAPCRLCQLLNEAELSPARPKLGRLVSYLEAVHAWLRQGLGLFGGG